MTLQLLSAQAVEFCSAASVWAYKEALLPGSQRRDAKFRSLRKKAFLTGSAAQSLDRSCERHQATTTTLYVATCRNIFFPVI